MQTCEPGTGNQTLVALPALTLAGEQFVYREAPWIEALIRASLAGCGVLLVVVAWRAGATLPLAFATLSAVGAGTMIYGAIYLHTRRALNFICTTDGLYFPERRPLTRAPRLWLFVPWKNVLDYRVQRMFDETSSRGVMLAIDANTDETQAFLTDHRVFNLSALRHPATGRAVLIGYSTFMPGPQSVVAQLRRFETGAGATEPNKLMASIA
jgi:hypothetical protein